METAPNDVSIDAVSLLQPVLPPSFVFSILVGREQTETTSHIQRITFCISGTRHHVIL